MRDPLGQLRLRFTELTLRTDGPHGQVYSGRDFAGAEVTLAVLSDQAAGDPARRSTFADAVRRLESEDLESEDMAALHGADLYASRPWAAVRSAPQRPGADRLLASLDHPQQPPKPAAPAPPAGPAPPAPVPGSAGVTRPRPAPARRASVAIGAITALVMTGGVAYVLLGVHQSGSDAAPAGPPAPATPAPPATESTAAPSVLREVEPVSVIGPVWAPGDDTYTMALPGFPFAFRTPATWQCLLGSYESLPEAMAWQCAHPDETAGGPRVNVMLWKCPTTCTEDEQASMIHAWLDEPERAVPADSGRTVYVETGPDGEGLYSVDLSHFAPDPADLDGPLRWHVGVYLQSPFDARELPLKVLNDILTQAS